MLKEVIIVEGKNDIAAVKRAIEAEVIATGGFGLNGATLGKIRIAYERRGIIILTDPDHAGNMIRKRLLKHFPAAGQAFLTQEDAAAHGDIGVERASPENIRAALGKARTNQQVKRATFSMAELFAAGLNGQPHSARRRGAAGRLLGIGYADARQFLARLNDYAITREEFARALDEAEREPHAGER